MLLDQRSENLAPSNQLEEFRSRRADDPIVHRLCTTLRAASKSKSGNPCPSRLSNLGGF
jgi:hypothetical protein